VALAGVAVAAVLHGTLLPFLADQWAAALFLLAVVVAASYGGFGPALLATVSGALFEIGFWSLRHPLATLAEPANWVTLTTFLLAGCAVALVTRWREGTLRLVSEERDRLRQLERDLRATHAMLREAKDLAEKARQQAETERDALQRDRRIDQERMGIAEGAGRLCLFDWDIAHGHMFVGDALAEILGIRRAEWNGYESLIAIVHPDDRSLVEGGVAECLTGGGILDVEFRVVWPDRSVRWVIARGSTYHDGPTAQRMAGIFQDVTQRKSTEDALVANEKLAAAGRLAASIAHEINNPLAAVTNLLYIIRSDTTLSGAGRQYLALAEKELARAAQIAKQTLGFYKEETEPAAVDLAQLLDEVLAFHRRNMPAHVALERHYPRKLEICCREGEIRQVVSNLMTNALHALGEGGTIDVEARRTKVEDESGVLLNVSDTGSGIEAADMDRLFEPFFTTTTRGTGLGLWLVKQIVKKHGGTIHVESSREARRHGTRFSIFLPARANARQAAVGNLQTEESPPARAS
jgi:PAS domain S-box-containing protein